VITIKPSQKAREPVPHRVLNTRAVFQDGIQFTETKQTRIGRWNTLIALGAHSVQ